MLKEFQVSTKERFQLIDITDRVGGIVEDKHSLAVITLPHSTAAVLITENEKNLKRDWIDFLKSQVAGKDFQHDKIDNNADSHLLSGLLGQQKTIPVENGKLILGTWQQIFLVELDGPRTRKVKVKLL